MSVLPLVDRTWPGAHPRVAVDFWICHWNALSHITRQGGLRSGMLHFGSRCLRYVDRGVATIHGRRMEAVIHDLKNKEKSQIQGFQDRLRGLLWSKAELHPHQKV